MSRPIAFIVLILIATLTAAPPNAYIQIGTSDLTHLQPSSIIDPPGAPGAFNLTYAMSDHYTNVTATTQPLIGNLTWFAALRRTSDNSSIPNTAFSFNITTSSSAMGIQSVRWNVTIPNPGLSCPSCAFTVVRFTVIDSTLIAGTNATYAFLKNATTVFGPNNLANRTTNIPSSLMGTVCPEARQICFNASGHVNSTLTLRFLFGWNLTGAGLKIMKVEVGKLLVFSTSLSFTNSDSHGMVLTSSVAHTANVTLSYNRTITAGASHNWNSSIITIYYPTLYQLDRIINNTATFYPAMDATVPDRHPFEKGSCEASDCTAIFPTSFVSLNMTDDRSVAKILTILATTPNAVTSIETGIRTAPTNFWMPGDTVTVRMRSEPRVNASGSQTISLTPPVGASPPNQTFTNRGGTYSYDVTIPETAALGKWNVTGEFLNGYDFGRLVHQIWLEEITTTPLTLTGTAGQGGTLTVRGTLSYMSNSTTAAAGVNATVFVVNAGSLPGPVVSLAAPPSEGLYISNITLANGVFTQGKSLLAIFKISNPSPSTAFSANITIEHLWYDTVGGAHGATAFIQLQPSLGEPFLRASSDYLMDVTLNSAGVQVIVKSLTTSNSVSRTLSTGTSGVPAFRQHFGNLRISVASKTSAGSLMPPHSLTSPPYAYVLHAPLIQSQLLSFSSTQPTSPDGSFSVSIPANRTLGANRLTAFVLARHLNGIVLAKDQTVTVADSTFLTPTAIIPGELTVGQSATVTLSLKSNSSRLTVTLTVNLVLSGSGTLDSKSLTIGPGQTETATFTFTAPAEAGSYLLALSSPQYGPLISPKTLQVYLLQSSLQVLVPAIIGLVAALVTLGAYLIRRRPEVEVEKEEKKRPAQGKPSKPAQSSSPRNP